MHTTITGRHGDMPERLRARAEVILKRLALHASRPLSGTVVFDTSPLQTTAEIRLHVARGEVLVASGRGQNHRTALDRAEEKLRRQLDKKSPRPRRRIRTARDKA